MRWVGWAGLILFAGLVGMACGSHRDALPPPSPSATPADMPAGPEAKINVSYAHRNDFLSSLMVTKFAGAEPLMTTTTKEGDAATVRFEGGVTVWQFGVEKGLLAGVPVIGSAAHQYAPKQVRYGDLPAHFVASIPDSGPPEPLETDHYYVFSVTRGDGSTSDEAVKVNGDGSLEAFAAEPRAGTSYRLCCNIPADFTVSAPTQ